MAEGMKSCKTAAGESMHPAEQYTAKKASVAGSKNKSVTVPKAKKS